MQPEQAGCADKLSNMHYLNPVFVTVRPDKDDRQKMDNVVSLFDTNHNRMGMRLLGVTGAETQKVQPCVASQLCCSTQPHMLSSAGYFRGQASVP